MNKKITVRIALILTFTFIFAFITTPGCKKAAPKSSAEQEIKDLLKKWYGAFQKDDFNIQWDLLSSDSSLRTRFTSRYSYPDNMSEEEKSKDAFVKVSGESFSPFKQYEIYALTIKDKKADVFVVTHWAGYLKKDGKSVRPMRKRGTLELVKENGKWLVFDRKEGFIELSVQAKTSAIEELLTTKETDGGNIIDIDLSPDKTSLFFLSDVGAAGFYNLKTKKVHLLPPAEGSRSPLFVGKDADVRVLGWSPLSRFFALTYRSPGEDFTPTLCIFDKSAKLVLRAKIDGKIEQAFFSPDGKNIVLDLAAPEGTVSKVVKIELGSGNESVLWDRAKPKEKQPEIEQVFGVYQDKLIVSLTAADEEKAHSVGTIDLKNGQLEDLSSKCPVPPGVDLLAHSLVGQRLVILTAHTEDETTTLKLFWRDLQLNIFNFLTGKTRKVKFLQSLPAQTQGNTLEIKNPVESFALSPARNRVLFSFFDGESDVLMLDSLKLKEFQSIYPRFWDQENTRVPRPPESLIDVVQFDWSPGRDNILFVLSPNRLFVATKDFIWKPVEIKELSGKIDGPAFWQSDTRIIYVGQKEAGKKDAETRSKGIYAIDVSLQ